MLFTLKQLRYLIAIADHKNISKAAQALHISQPSLSAAIHQLENRFNAQLLIRYKAKGVALTPTGRQFVAEARQFLLHSDELARNIGQYTNQLEGNLTLGCYTTIAPFFIPSLLRHVKRKHPRLSIRSLEKNLDELQNDLFSGLYELALIYNINLDSDISTRVLKQCKPHIVLPRQHPLAGRKKIALKQLADEPYIMLDLPNSRDYFTKVFDNNNVSPSIRHRTHSFEMVRCLVAQQHGYSILNLVPHTNATYDNGRVAIVEMAGRQEPLEIVLAQVKNLKLTRRAQVFADLCKNYFAST